MRNIAHIRDTINYLMRRKGICTTLLCCTTMWAKPRLKMKRVSTRTTYQVLHHLFSQRLLLKGLFLHESSSNTETDSASFPGGDLCIFPRPLTSPFGSIYSF